MPIAVRPDAPAADPAGFAAVATAAVQTGAPLRVQVGNEACEVRGDVAIAVVEFLRAVGSGSPVTVAALPRELTTGQAADLLGVSRPTVVALADKGTLPATRIGTHRRLRTQDVLAFRDRARATRREALDEMTVLSEDLGLYD
jgi:excisionase family DNA binding protein